MKCEGEELPCNAKPVSIYVVCTDQRDGFVTCLSPYQEVGAYTSICLCSNGANTSKDYNRPADTRNQL